MKDGFQMLFPFAFGDNDEKEEWKQMSEGQWAISSNGRMICLSETQNGGRQYGHLIKFRPVNKTKYLGTVLLGYNSKRQMFMPHKLVAKYFLGPRPLGMVINHKDGNTHNNCVSNLEYCTHLQNMQHAVKFGLIKRKKKVVIGNDEI